MSKINHAITEENPEITVNVKVEGVAEAQEKAEALIRMIKEATALTADLASELKKLIIKVD